MSIHSSPEGGGGGLIDNVLANIPGPEKLVSGALEEGKDPILGILGTVFSPFLLAQRIDKLSLGKKGGGDKTAPTSLPTAHPK